MNIAMKVDEKELAESFIRFATSPQQDRDYGNIRIEQCKETGLYQVCFDKPSLALVVMADAFISGWFNRGSLG